MTDQFRLNCACFGGIGLTILLMGCQSGEQRSAPGPDHVPVAQWEVMPLVEPEVAGGAGSPAPSKPRESSALKVDPFKVSAVSLREYRISVVANTGALMLKEPKITADGRRMLSVWAPRGYMDWEVVSVDGVVVKGKSKDTWYLTLLRGENSISMVVRSPFGRVETTRAYSQKYLNSDEAVP